MTILRFGPFLLDVADASVRRGDDILKLTPKAFAVLELLAGRPNQLVTKKELLDSVWADVIVGDAVIKVTVREIRKALDDDPRDPRFIQTVHRRGYRFVGDVVRETASAFGSGAPPPRSPIAPVPDLVAREDATSQLDGWLDDARGGQRRMVFVTGEPGIGKTSLVEAFAARAAATPAVWIARGQCIEHYGSGEAYLPVLDALGRLCRCDGADAFVELLARYAPTWIAQMPALAGQVDVEQLEVLGATHERMLREMAEALEVFLDGATLLLVLEDLHWADFSTLDLISLLARRPGSARLMVVGTYRPVDLVISGHPLRGLVRDLSSHRVCEDLPLRSFDEAGVGEYLGRRFPERAFDAGVTRRIHEQTGGNPLFVSHVADHFESQDGGGLDDTVVPEGIRQVMERRFESLAEPERKLLEAGSVAGHEFDAAALVGALRSGGDKDATLDAVEERGDALAARGDFLRSVEAPPWPDGTVSARYMFRHALVQNIVYDQVSPSRRARLHRWVGEALEGGYGDADGQAAALALHFEHAHQPDKAIHYLQRAAANARRRHANREALGHLVRATELVGQVRGSERLGLLLDVLEGRGLIKRAMGDMSGAADEFDALVQTAREAGNTEREVEALLLLGSVLFWVGRERCLATVDEALARSREIDNELLRAHAAGWCAHWNLNLRGWSDDDAAACLHAVESARRHGDRRLLCLHVVRSVYLHMLRSDYDVADRAAQEGAALALELADAFDYLLVHFFRAWTLLHAGRWDELLRVLDHGEEIARKNGHELWEILFGLVRGQLCDQCFAYEEATALAEPALTRASEFPSETGQLRYHGSIVRGLAELCRNKPGNARKWLDPLEGETEHVDWMLHLPWLWGRAASRTKAKSPAQSIAVVQLLLKTARGPGERTYLALGHRVAAEAHLHAGELDRASAELEKARAVLKQGAAPLAEWRVEVTAGRLKRAQQTDGDACWRAAEECLEILAETLGEAPDLQATIRKYRDRLRA